MAIRLNKYISDSGICSRREADRYIEMGQVLVNGKRAHVGDQVTGQDRVVVNGNLIEPRGEEETVYILFNKPPGLTTTTTAGIKDNIIRYIKHSVRLVPVGQLDKEAQGLVLLTSNGELVNKILRASHVHENEYIVMVDKPLTEQALEALANGAGQPGAEAQNIRVAKETPYIFRITLLHDTIRQIRRWCEQLGYEVVQMERIRVMHLSVKALGVGEWRDLRAGELKVLLETVEQAGSSAPAGARRRKKPNTAEFWKERPAAAAPAGKPRTPAAPRPEDAWLELPAEAAPATSRPRPSSRRPAGTPGAASSSKPGRPVGPRGAGPGKGTAGSKPGRPAAPGRNAAAAPKGKTSGRGTRGASRTGRK